MEFASTEEAKKAVKKSGQELEGRKLVIHFVRENKLSRRAGGARAQNKLNSTEDGDTARAGSERGSGSRGKQK